MCVSYSGVVPFEMKRRGFISWSVFCGSNRKMHRAYGDKTATERIADSSSLQVISRSLMALTPLILAVIGWVAAGYLDKIEKLNEAQHTEKLQAARDLGEINAKLAVINGTTTQLGIRIDAMNSTFNSRLDMQSQWLQQQASDIDELKRRVYPLTVPVPAQTPIPPELRAREKWTTPR